MVIRKHRVAQPTLFFAAEIYNISRASGRRVHEMVKVGKRFGLRRS